jgi:lipoprotein-releasing system ATP-binding protein
LGEFTAKENVSLPLIISGLKDSEAEERAEQLLIKVGLKDRMTHRPGQLSGGEQQRVAIARAIVNKPLVVLSDEPTGNLDFSTAKQIQDLLFGLQDELKSLMLIVTHNRELAASCKYCFEMQPGGDVVDVPR